MNKRLLIVFMLGFSSGLPLALLTGALQAWFSESGLSLMTIGLLSLIGLPYGYRFLWAPLLDRYALCSLGKRRSWALTTQILLCLGFNGMAWLSPVECPGVMMALAVVLTFLSATQDIAIDAHRTEYLRTEEQALGASLAICGYRMALLVAGGLSLILAQHMGWAVSYRLMGSLLLIGMIAVLMSPEPSMSTVASMTVVSRDDTAPNASNTLWRIFIEPAHALWSRPGILFLLLFIFFYKVGEAFTASTSGVVMPFLIQGLGFSLDTIGMVNKIVGVGAAIAGGLMAGLMLMRWSLYRALLVFGLFQAVSSLWFVALAALGQQTALLCMAVVCENMAAGMSSVALVTLFMRLVDRRFTATQFSMLVAFSTLPRTFAGPIAALVHARFGWIGVYELSFLLALGFVPWLMLLSQKRLSWSDEPLGLTSKI